MEDEFSGLVEMHSSEIFRYLWRMTYHSQDAEDCLQETFFKAYRAYPRLTPDSNHRAWLYRIATNTARSLLKKNTRQNRLMQEWGPALQQEDSEPKDRFVERETIELVLTEVDALPAKQKASLILRKYHDLSYAEIGEITDASPDAARANAYLALKTLRLRLRDEALEKVTQ